MKIPAFTQQLKQLLAKDQINPVLQQLKVFLENSPAFNEVLQHSGRFADLEQRIRQGTINDENAVLVKNQIRTGLLAFLDELEEKKEDPTLIKEMDEVKSNHPTVINQAEKIYNIDHIDNANFS